MSLGSGQGQIKERDRLVRLGLQFGFGFGLCWGYDLGCVRDKVVVMGRIKMVMGRVRWLWTGLRLPASSNQAQGEGDVTHCAHKTLVLLPA